MTGAEILELFKYFLNSLLPMLIVFIILNGAFRNMAMKKRIFGNMISGGVLFLIFAGAVLIDFLISADLYLFYAMFALSSIIMSGAFILFLFFIAKKNNVAVQLKSRRFARQDFLYIVFEYKGNIILQRTQKGVSGLLLPLKNVVFHDVALEQLFHLLKIDLYKEHVKYVGKASLGGKVEQVFHCYYIGIDEISEKFANYVEVEKRDVIQLSMIEFDKQLILRTIMKEDFDIHL